MQRYLVFMTQELISEKEVKLDSPSGSLPRTTMKIDQIKVNPEWYSRATAPSEEAIEEKYDAYKRSDILPPVLINKNNGWINGFDRLKAQQQLGRTEIDIAVEDIPDEEVLKRGVYLNARNGRPLSQEDRLRLIKIFHFEQYLPGDKVAELLNIPISTVYFLIGKVEENSKIVKPDLRKTVMLKGKQGRKHSDTHYARAQVKPPNLLQRKHRVAPGILVKNKIA